MAANMERGEEPWRGAGVMEGVMMRARTATVFRFEGGRDYCDRKRGRSIECGEYPFFKYRCCAGWGRWGSDAVGTRLALFGDAALEDASGSDGVTTSGQKIAVGSVLLRQRQH